MDYRRVFSRAWRHVWKYKYLWVLGFFAGLALGGGGDGISLPQGGAWLFQNVGNIVGTQRLNLVLTLAVALVLWLLGIIARSGLIHEVAAIEARRPKPIGRIGGLFRAGLGFLPRILLMQLLIWAPVLVLGLVAAISGQAVSEAMLAGIQEGQLELPGFGTYGALGLLSCGVTLLTIPLTLVDAFAYRAIVLGDLGAVGGIRRAVEVIRGNLGDILFLSVICLVIAIGFSLALSVVLSPLLLLMARPLMQGVSQCAGFGGDFEAAIQCMQQLSADPTLVAASLVGSIVAAALSSVWVAFQSAVGTLAYKQLT